MDSPLSRRGFLGTGLKTAAALGLVGAGATLPNGALERLASFRPDKKVTTNLGKEGTITVALYGNAASNAVAVKAFSKFEQQTGIKATPVFLNVSSWVEFLQELETRLAAGVNIDTANIATEGELLFSSRGALEPLDSYIAKDHGFVNSFLADINPQILATFKAREDIGGHTYFMPFGYNTMGIWYNRQVFKENSVKEPSAGWTWDDFLAASAKLSKSPQKFAMNLTIDVFQGIEPWVFTNGGQVLNSTWTKCIVDNPAAVEATAFARSLVSKGYAPAPGGQYDQFTELAAGRLAMLGAGAWPYGYYVDNGGMSDFAIAPWPINKKPGTPFGVGAYCILKSSQNKDAVWEYIKYTMSDDYQLNQVLPIQGGLPMKTSIATSREFLSKLPPGADYFPASLSDATFVVGVDNAGAVEGEIDTVWEQILTGNTTPGTGLAQLQAKCNDFMAQKV